ncbi:MAG: helicase [Planctomycetota bacterium]|jgi:hypothetical protein
MGHQAEQVRRSLPSSVRIGDLPKPRLLQALLEHDIQLNQAAETLFEDPRFVPASGSSVVEIVARSVAELGFPTGAVYEDLKTAAFASGWVECPLELGPYLRLQFLDQPEPNKEVPRTSGRAPKGSITIASQPLDSSDETPKGFYLRQIDNQSWLRGYWSDSDHVWNSGDILVFSRQDAGKADNGERRME